jgi:hypothetical protein
MTYSADEITQMALQFTRATSQALSFLELPSKTDGEMFEGLMDQVADNLMVCEHAWDLFACTARIEFFGSDAPEADRKRWARLGSAAREQLDRSWAAECEADRADYYNDLARDERMMEAL